ncbi:unnamed protein product [Bursaphelenchus xylophilus]|uniref:(pine wood nematode) hypothetical protein n=1 Tax=Bursaphelenchus xylophilus TaxID=6326 RepID=A0A1I7S1X2_BURXY|nr:unnamed protein product [Bursaphelenchus xylophilus]CAG9090063.1 unnamed protein product [Bursaphelenchus xylophilus]
MKLYILLMLALVGWVCAAAASEEEADRFSRTDRDYRPLQFGKRGDFRPLQFGKKDNYRPLQFGKRAAVVNHYLDLLPIDEIAN